MLRQEIWDNGQLVEVIETPLSDDDHNAGIRRQLEQLDIRSIRALREDDANRIAEIEAAAAVLRASLR